MSRTFIDQPTQVFKSDLYDDSLTTGIGLQSGSTTLQTDLNAIRTQIRRLIWGDVSGSWYDTLPQASGSYGVFSARGVGSLGNDLNNVEQHRFLYRRQVLSLLNVATGSNVVQLSTSLGTAPANYAVVNNDLISTGTIVATVPTYGTWSSNQVSGSTVITPKNLVVIRDAWTHSTLTNSLGQEIFGLLQVETGSTSGAAFNDVNGRTQISFVYETMLLGTSSLTSVATSDIGGKTVQYTYVTRMGLKDLPEDAYLSNEIFIDTPMPQVGGSTVSLSDITLQRAITNQGSSVVTDNNGTSIQLAAGASWIFLSGTTKLWELASTPSGQNTLAMNLYSYGLSSSLPAAFQKGISVATGSTQINVGVTAGWIESLGSLTLRSFLSSALVLSGGSQIQFGDSFGGSSTYTTGLIPFATSTLEWSNFKSNFGQISLLGALNTLSAGVVASGALRRYRAQSGVTADVAANTNITFPTNLENSLLDYSARTFTSDVNVYLNGILLMPGASVSDYVDVYPGTTRTSGDLKFSMNIRSGSVITMEIFGNS